VTLACAYAHGCSEPTLYAARCARQIPDVTNRLRSKVDNYAIYSALFLSFSVPSALDPPERFSLDDELQLAHHLFFFALCVGVAAHLLSILLAMSFTNALNEAARDADVFRLFAKGQGFLATVKCEEAFRVGAAANVVAMLAALHLYIGDVAYAYFALVGVTALLVLVPTHNRLFRCSSIVDYWRKGRLAFKSGRVPHAYGL